MNDLPFVKRSFHSNILILFGLIAVIVAGIAGFGYYAQRRFGEDNRWVAHTYEVLDHLNVFLSALNDAETGQRGYIITGQESYLAPYRSARTKVEEELAHLKSLTADNASQQRRLPRMERLAHDRMDLLETFLVARRTSGFEEARKGILQGQGKRLMDELSRLYVDMEKEEHRLLEIRNRKAEASIRAAQLANLGGTVTIFAVLLLTYSLIRSESRRRFQAESRLRERHDEDEKRVQELEGLRAEMARINIFGEMLQNCMNPEEAYGIIRKSIPLFFPRDSGALSLVNSSRNLVELRLVWGDRPTTAEVFGPEECWGLRRGRTHIIEDARTEMVCAHIQAAVPTEDGQARVNREYEADIHFLCQPMMAQGETLGVFQLVRRGELWSESEKLLAVTLSEMIAVAIANLHLQEALRHQSIRDPLTGLFNRRYMEEALEQEIARSQRSGDPVGVMMFDVDHFKRFNDNFGHEAGDVLLAQIGSCMQSQLRKEDIVCRYGGEEFLIILRQADLDIVHGRAEQLLETIRSLTPKNRGQSLGTVTVSIGIAAYPIHGTTPDEVVRSADDALYRAKREGRNRIAAANTELPKEEDMVLKSSRNAP